MKIKRDGRIYVVLAETPTEVCVRTWMLVYHPFKPPQRKWFHLWWGKHYCEEIQ